MRGVRTADHPEGRPGHGAGRHAPHALDQRQALDRRGWDSRRHLQPGDRARNRDGGLRDRGRGRTRRWPPPAAALPGWRETSLAKRAGVLFAFRELVRSGTPELAAIITAEHGKVRLRRARRGRPRPGGRRVRLRHPAPAQGRLLRERRRPASTSYSIRQPLGVGRRHHAVQLPGDGADVDVRRSRSPAATPSCSSRREKDPSASLLLAELLAEAGPARRRVQRRARRQGGRRRDADPPGHRRGELRRLDPDRAVHLRDAAPPHGKRVQALGGAKNHMVVLPDADLDLAADAAVTAGFGSAGERCMAISVVGRGRRRSATSWSTQDRRAAAEADGRRRRRRRHRHGPAGHPRSTGTRWPATSTPGAPTAPRSSSTAAHAVTARADGFCLGPTLLDHVTPEMSVYTDEIFGPVLSVVRADDLRGGAGR